jgi:hypothetical protein
MRVYTAGKMTGVPQFNFPKFIAFAAKLRAAGYDVVSPAELDNPADRARAMASPDGSPIHYESGMTHADFLARDIKIIADGGIDAIVVLPGEQWKTSTGARWETFSGYLCGLPIYRDMFNGPEPMLVRLDIEELASAWAGMDMVTKERLYEEIER